MAFSNRSTIFGWALILCCIIAVPVGLFSRASHAVPEKSKTKSKNWSILNQSDRIQVLHIYGAIVDQDEDAGFLPHTNTAAWAKKKLRKAADDNDIKGILLRINSPGGTVGMSQEVYDAVEFVRSKHKPVVVSMGDVAASGGYYIASAADRIFANAGTLTGSIGVIMHLMNWQETEKKIGFQPTVIKSGEFKDIGSSDRPMTAAEKALLQGIIMDSYDQFVTAVSQGRHMSKDIVKKLADGRIYSGRQAKSVSLVDELGGYEEALAWLQNKCKEQYKLKEDLEVDDGSSSLNFLSSMFQSSSSQSNVLSVNGLLKGLLPISADPNFNKVPLWIMQ